MTTYEVEFTKKAQKELTKLDQQTALRISKAIYKLSQNPRKGNVRPMVSSKFWRLRVGDYRIFYEILDKKLVILIIRIKHRREVYRDL